MIFASALSTEEAIDQAVSALTTQVLDRLAGATADLLLLFFSHHWDREAVRLTGTLRSALKPGAVLGCVGEGVLRDDHEVEEGPAIALLAAHLPDVHITPFAFRPTDWRTLLSDPPLLGRAVGAVAPPHLLILLADPFSTPINKVLAALNALYPNVPVVGGMISGVGRRGSHGLVLDGHVYANGLVGVAMSGAFRADTVVSQGCRPVGDPLTVTATAHNVILQIEGQSPLVHVHDLLRRLPEPDRLLLRRNGLFIGRAIRPAGEELGRGDFLIQNVLGLDQHTGAMALSDVIPEGQVVQFHLRDASTAREDLQMLLLPHTLFDPPRGALLFTCNGRGSRLYGYPNGDVSIVREMLGQVALAGTFCAGELGPIGGQNYLHGHTASLTLFRLPSEKR